MGGPSSDNEEEEGARRLLATAGVGGRGQRGNTCGVVDPGVGDPRVAARSSLRVPCAPPSPSSCQLGRALPVSLSVVRIHGASPSPECGSDTGLSGPGVLVWSGPRGVVWSGPRAGVWSGPRAGAWSGPRRIALCASSLTSSGMISSSSSVCVRLAGVQSGVVCEGVTRSASRSGSVVLDALARAAAWRRWRSVRWKRRLLFTGLLRVPPPLPRPKKCAQACRSSASYCAMTRVRDAGGERDRFEWCELSYVLVEVGTMRRRAASRRE